MAVSLYVCTVCAHGRVQVLVCGGHEDFRIDSEVHYKGAHPLCGAFEPTTINPIKLAHDPCRPDGRLHSDQRL